ncbi:MAG TPA: hypothetical protein VMF30_02340, partial [Pirellulales bacterium]|nr:hypothetical protein [Pirellulales bacterium]
MGIAAIVLCVAASCLAADDGPEETARTVDYYLERMLAERQKIHSGEFVVLGTETEKFVRSPSLDYSGKLHIYCTFDEARIRFDNHEPFFDVEGSDRLRLGRAERKSISTAAYSLNWIETPRESRIIISDPTTINGQFLYFDVRALGLIDSRDLNAAGGCRLAPFIDRLLHRTRDKSVDTSDPACVQLVLVRELGAWADEFRYWIRPDQGFAPVKLEVRTRLDDPDEPWE